MSRSERERYQKDRSDEKVCYIPDSEEDEPSVKMLCRKEPEKDEREEKKEPKVRMIKVQREDYGFPGEETKIQEKRGIMLTTVHRKSIIASNRIEKESNRTNLT